MYSKYMQTYKAKGVGVARCLMYLHVIAKVGSLNPTERAPVTQIQIKILGPWARESKGSQV